MKDKRHQHPGTQPLLSVVEQAQLLQTLQAPPADGGLWNSRKDKHIILAIDQAGWHTSPQVRVPEGL